MNALRWPATAVLLVALATLSACGSNDSGGSGQANDSTSTASASPSPGAGNQPGGGDPSQLAAIQQCLEAAGLSSALPSGGPGAGGTPPSGMPTDLPSGMPTDMPSGGPGGALQNPEVQAALEACGISLPSAPPS